jgi:hypothetical protein
MKSSWAIGCVNMELMSTLNDWDGHSPKILGTMSILTWLIAQEDEQKATYAMSHTLMYHNIAKMYTIP